MQNNELLHCPFCGKPAGMHFNGYGNNEFIVRCTSALRCGARSSSFSTEIEAKTAWNKRVTTKNWRDNSEHKKPAETQQEIDPAH